MVDVESTSLPEELRRGGLLQWVWGIRSLLGMKRVEKRVAGDEATSIQERVSREEPPSGDDIRDLPRDDSTSTQDSPSTRTIPYGFNTEPPIYKIDLSKPPQERYTHVLRDFTHATAELPALFEEICHMVKPRLLPMWLIHLLFWLLFRHLYSAEHTLELRGISTALSIPMYLLVFYNVFVDLLMGCTSGGMLVVDQDTPGAIPRMMHFRTLDWEMPAIRTMIAKYEFVAREGGPTVAETVSYVGYVGVLTGVRQDLSVSLNSRPYRQDRGFTMTSWRYYWHLSMVVLGRRPTLASTLREVIIPRTMHPHADVTRLLHGGISLVAAHLATIPTPVAYLTLCSGIETIVLEKDFVSAKLLSSHHFIAVTNHDEAADALPKGSALVQAADARLSKGLLDHGLERAILWSQHRKQFLVDQWNAAQAQRVRSELDAREAPDPGGRPAQQQVDWDRFVDCLMHWPLRGVLTHFVCVMDPYRGRIAWTTCTHFGVFSERSEGGEGEEEREERNEESRTDAAEQR